MIPSIDHTTARGRLLRLLCVALMVLSMMVAAPLAPRQAYADDPEPDLTITTPAELKAFADAVNAGDTFAGKLVVLANDIDLSTDPLTEKWVPIGRAAAGTTGPAAPFKGDFDGRFNRIDGLFIDDTVVPSGSGFSPAALFGFASNGTIQNLVVAGTIDVTSAAAAGFVGKGNDNTGGVTLRNLGNEVDISSPGSAAGIAIGYTGTSGVAGVYQCYNKGDITSSNPGNGGSAAGIICGGTTAIQCYNLGTISKPTGTATSNWGMGGILGTRPQGSGANSVNATGSYNAGTVNYPAAPARSGAIIGSHNSNPTLSGTVVWLTGSAAQATGSGVYVTSGNVATANVIEVSDAQLQGTDLDVIDVLTTLNGVSHASAVSNAFKPGNTYPLLWWERTIIGAPVITAQPQISGVEQNEAATPFEVTATVPGGTKPATSGSITEVEWFSNTVASYEGTPTSVRTSAPNTAEVTDSYTPPTTTVGDAWYWAELTNSWQAPVYKVIYDENGGSGTAPVDSEGHAPDTEATVTDDTGLVAPSGKRFWGWSTDKNATVPRYAPGDTFLVSNTTYLFAVWADSYQLTYDANGADSGTPPAVATYYRDESVTVAANTNLVKADKVFSGWNTAADGSGAFYKAGAALTLTEPTTLYAVWGIAAPVLTYNSNGSNGNPPAAETHANGDVVSVRPTPGLYLPSEEPASFGGWNSEPDGSGTFYLPNTTFTIVEDMTLYVQWVFSSSIPLKFNANDPAATGTPPADIAFIPTIQTLPTFPGNAAETPMAVAGKAFVGWNTAADGSGTQYLPGSTYRHLGRAIITDVTMYAVWVPACTVTYDDNGADSGTAPAAIEPAIGLPMSTPGVGTLAKTDNLFLGWSENQSATTPDYVANSTFIPTGDTTLYAVWVPTVYDTATATIRSNIVRFRTYDPAAAPTTPVLTTQPQEVSWAQHSVDGVLTVEHDPTSVNTDGTLSYQWYSNDVDSNSDGIAIPATNSPEYAPPTAVLGTTYYYCVITNTVPDGRKVSVTSDAAAVHVHAIEITTPADLLALQQSVAGTGGTQPLSYDGFSTLDAGQPMNYAGYVIELLNDIDLSGYGLTEEWAPIGIDSLAPFRGTFEGHGHTISGLNLTGYEGPYVGLFGYVDGAASVSDLVVRGSIEVGDNAYTAIGGVVGYLGGTATLKGVGSEVDVVSTSDLEVTVGGLVGIVNGSATQSRISASYHSGVAEGSTRVGGLVGYVTASVSAGAIASSYNTGSVVLNDAAASSRNFAGGLVGYSSTGNIVNSFNAATVTSQSGSAIGGLVGAAGSNVQTTNSYYLSGVTGEEDIDAKGTATKTADEMADPAFAAELNGTGDEIFKVPEGGGLPGLAWEGTTTSTVDPSALSTAITDATAAKVGISESADGTDIDPAIQWVTPEVMQTFNAAITSAQATFDGAPTQPQVDAAVTRLTDAIAAFEAAKASGTFVLEPPPPPPPPPPAPPTDESWKRLSGDNRYDTMAAIVSEAFSASDTDAVIVATGENFPDALAASGLAGIADAPVVLTEGGALSAQAQSTIEALEPTTVYIAGGTGSVSVAVEDALKGLVDDPAQVIRSAGTDRYSTALDIYAKGKEAGAWGTTAIIASGDNYADALSVSPYSFAEKAPIFLSDPAAGLDAATVATLSAALEAGEITQIIIAGGPGSVPDVIKVQLGYAIGDFATFTRLYGASRYDTSVAVANFAAADSEALGFHQIAAATGENFPDALAGGAFAGRVGTVLLLVSDDATGRVGIDSVVGANAASIGFGHVLGGVGTVSPALQSALEVASSQG